MEHWSILNNMGENVDHDQHQGTLHDLNVMDLNDRNHKKLYNSLKAEERQTLYIDFGNSPNSLK